MSPSRVLLATGAALALAGCSGPHVYDQEAHREALEAHGVEVTEAMQSACDSKDPVMFVVGWVSEGGDPEVVRIGVEHLCPDRLDEYGEVLG